VTCIVALEHEGKTYIGGDSAGVKQDDLSIIIRADEKVFATGGMLMGFCGSYRIGQLLRYAFTAPEQSAKKDDMCYLVTDFVDALREMQKEKGSIIKENELEATPGEFILSYNNKLYMIESDFQVGRPTDSFVAIGCGAEYALGSLYTTCLMPSMGPEERVRLALSAAAKYSMGVREPFVIVDSSMCETGD